MDDFASTTNKKESGVNRQRVLLAVNCCDLLALLALGEPGELLAPILLLG